MDSRYHLHDFGRAAFGTLTATLAGPPGTEVELVIGEVLRNGRIDRNPGGYRCAKTCRIVLDAGEREYCFPIPRHRRPEYAAMSVPSPLAEEVACFRYAEVIGACRVPSVRRREVFPPSWNEEASGFVCDDDRVNRIWELCKYSIKATAAFGVFIDGERERCPYEGDAYINQLGWFCNSADPEIPRRTIELFTRHRTWPIEWSLLMPPIVRDYLLYTGDTASVSEWIPMLKTRLLEELERPDGLIGENDFYKELIDWPPGERDGYESDGVSLVPNCCRHAAFLAMAELTGDETYRRRAAALRAVIRRTMWTGTRFVDSPGSSHTAVHSVFFPVAFQAAAPEELPELRMLPMRCGVYGAQFLLDAMWMGGYDAEAYALLTAGGLRSWLHMLEVGTTITTEAWDDSLKPSQDWNHAWGAAPANLIPRRLCGIRPTAPGFRRFVVDPRPAGLTRFTSVHPTPGGAIHVEYRDRKLRVEFPRGMTGIFRGREYETGFQADME